MRKTSASGLRGSAVISPPPLQRTTFAATRHVLWALNTPKIAMSTSSGRKTHFWYIMGNVSGGRVVLFLLNEKFEATVVVYEYTVCYRVVAYQILRDYMHFTLYFGRRCFHVQNTPLFYGLHCIHHRRRIRGSCDCSSSSSSHVCHHDFPIGDHCTTVVCPAVELTAP